MKNIKKITKISIVLVFGLLVTTVYSRNFDRTGPQGLGPKTGLEQGECQNTNPKNKTLGLGLGRNSKTSRRLGLVQRHRLGANQKQGLGKTETRNGGLGLGINRNQNISSQKKIEALELQKDKVQSEIKNLKVNLK